MLTSLFYCLQYWFAFNSKRDLELAVLFQLVPMLQSLMYPNVVKVVAANDDTDEGTKVDLGPVFQNFVSLTSLLRPQLA